MERWHLSVLTAGLDLTGRTPTVATELFRYEDGQLRAVWQHRDPVADYGLGEADPPTAPLRVPAAVREGVGSFWTDDMSLWLRLVPPYGFLGAVPWETALAAGRETPVFRVPDRLPVAVEHCREVGAVLAVSAPAGSRWAADYVRGHLGHLRRHDRGDVHVFADRQTVAGLRGLDPEGLEIHVHDPGKAGQAYEERTRRGASRFDLSARGRLVVRPPAGRVWADWIAAELDGRPVRTLHVIVDAGWDHDRPILAVSPDPDQPVEIARCSYVTGDDIRRLADVIGASTLVLGSPPENPADGASRMVADALGRQRSGPTVYTSLPEDPEGAELAGMYAFLAAAPDEGELRRRSSLFAYLQPEHVAEHLQEDWPEALAATVLPAAYRPGSLDQSDLTDAPSWVSTSERYVATELAAMSRPADAPPVAPYRQAYENGKAEALNQIQEIVAKHLEQS
jgi:hypothetical protein